MERSDLARNPFGAAVLHVLGLVLVMLATLALAWLGLAWSGHPLGHEGALWEIRPDWKWPRDALVTGVFLGLTGAVMGLGGLFFKAARTEMRPASQSEDGLADLELTMPQLRAGHPVEGRLRILKASQPGETFRLTLLCTRPDSPSIDNSSRTETAFQEELTAAAVQDAKGLSVPFRFVVPITAPASSRDPEGYKWRLKVSRMSAWFALDRGFDLRVAAATPEELRALEAAQPAASGDDVADIERRVIALGKPPLAAHQRAQLAVMTPEEREEARRTLVGIDKLARGFDKLFLKILLGFLLMPIVLFAIFAMLVTVMAVIKGF